MKTTKIKEKFIEDFWEWFREYHHQRYAKEGKYLFPEIKYHERHMKFDNYAWEWVALFIKEEYINKKEAKNK